HPRRGRSGRSRRVGDLRVSEDLLLPRGEGAVDGPPRQWAGVRAAPGGRARPHPTRSRPGQRGAPAMKFPRSAAQTLTSLSDLHLSMSRFFVNGASAARLDDRGPPLALWKSRMSRMSSMTRLARLLGGVIAVATIAFAAQIGRAPCRER